MSREILFRAKCIDNGEWVEGYYCKRKLGYYNDFRFQGEYRDCIIKEFSDGGIIWREVCPDTICQYTGLVDEKGERIWENDIVTNKWCFMYGNSVVRFGAYKDPFMSKEYQCGHLGFFLEHSDNNDLNCRRKDMMYFAGKCEVIGNIFDNPELLKEDE